MKLIETAINKNLDLEYFYPTISEFVFGSKAIKYFKLYALDRTQIIYVDTFDKINLVLLNEKKKISKTEIDYIIKKLLHVNRSEVEVDISVKQKMDKNGIFLKKPQKDIIIIQQEVLAK